LCWAKGGGNEGGGPKGKKNKNDKDGAKDSAATAAEKTPESEDIEAWAAVEAVEEEQGSVDDELPAGPSAAAAEERLTQERSSMTPGRRDICHLFGISL
jgi:hypothetical protein